MSMRFVAMGLAAAVALAFTTAPTGAQSGYQNGCSARVAMWNKNRVVDGPLSIECGNEDGWWGQHSPPFGNWGADSPWASWHDGFQFPGWKDGDGWQMWNSCTTESAYAAPDPNHYNYGMWDRQRSDYWNNGSDKAMFGATNYFFPNVGCEAFDNVVVTVQNIFMHLKELDFDGNDTVGILEYDDLSVAAQCYGPTQYSWCTGYSGWIGPSQFVHWGEPPPGAGDLATADVELSIEAAWGSSGYCEYGC